MKTLIKLAEEDSREYPPAWGPPLPGGPPYPLPSSDWPEQTCSSLAALMR